MQRLDGHIAAVEAEIERIRSASAGEGIHLMLDLDRLSRFADESDNADLSDLHEHIGFMKQAPSPSPTVEMRTNLEHLRDLLTSWGRTVADTGDRGEYWSASDLRNIRNVVLWFERYGKLAKCLTAELQACLAQRGRDRCTKRGDTADGCCDLHGCVADLIAHRQSESVRFRNSQGRCVVDIGEDASYADLVPPIQTAAKSERGWEPPPKTNFLGLLSTTDNLCQRLKEKPLKRLKLDDGEREALRVLRTYLSASVSAPLTARIRESAGNGRLTFS